MDIALTSPKNMPLCFPSNRPKKAKELPTGRAGCGNAIRQVLEGDRVLATAYGELFCLDASQGNALWHNPLKGFGRGLATIATEDNPGISNAAVLSERHRRDEAAAAAASAASAGRGMIGAWLVKAK